MKPLLECLSRLIEQPSVSPDDANCQTIIQQYLEACGFHCTSLPSPPVDNLWACHGHGAPCLVFAGHTDVVPAGNLNHWQSPPFTPSLRDGVLYGRGSADMKGALAAMLVAIERFVKHKPQHAGSIGFIITSGEEGEYCQQGTPVVMEYLAEQGIAIDYGLVGEPSCEKRLGDTIKIGRRGSLHGELIVHGKQGHVAYPHLAKNPLHHALPALHALVQTKWDEGNEDFPASTLQISHIHAGEGASNVIPGSLQVQFNIRFSNVHHPDTLKKRIIAVLQEHHLQHYDLNWRLSGLPFLSPKGHLRESLQSIIYQHTGIEATLSTGGGTSDARFIAPYGIEVLEFGLRRHSIHQANEHIKINELEQLCEIYHACLEKLLSK